VIAKCTNPLCRGTMHPDEDTVLRCMMCGRTPCQTEARLQSPAAGVQLPVCPHCGKHGRMTIASPQFWLARHLEVCQAYRGKKGGDKSDYSIDAICRVCP